jgi:hypothetical protein
MQSADKIETLPIDLTVPSSQEVQLANTFFTSPQTNVQKLLEGTKDVLILGLLFVGFSLPAMDETIQKFFVSAKNSFYVLLLIKTLLFMFSFFIIKNVYLARKNKN